MTLNELDTPAVVIDLDRLEANLGAMQAACDAAGVALRPHIKTHKCPEIARFQLRAGARGLTVAKLGEAEVMADLAGCDDLFIAYPLLGESKLARLRALCERAEVRVSVCSLDQARLLSAGLGATRVKVRLNVDTGLLRDGFEPDAALDAAQRIADLPGLDLVGVFTHEGHCARLETPAAVAECGRSSARRLVEVAERLREQGLPVTEVAPGSTPTALAALDVPGVTEVRPGTYCFWDANYVHRLGLDLDQCAARVVVTVVDHPAPERVIVDGGSKTFFADSGGWWGRARCVELPELTLPSCSEEHGQALWTGAGAAPVALGQRLTFVPHHICPVINLVDCVNVLRGEEVLDTWRIAARGMVS
ncbi:MAG: alanine racemase [Armatimonadetes bacterium]|nr:alanine racemase [Armatimonadota bacterium]